MTRTMSHKQNINGNVSAEALVRDAQITAELQARGVVGEDGIALGVKVIDPTTGEIIERDNTRIEVSKIRADGGTQSRAATDEEVVNDYADAMTNGATFPPITVFFDGSDYWLADGFHRYHAAKRAGKATIAVDIHQGTRRDAVLHSVGANASHGLRRTNADKRRAVETLLRDEEWTGWSDNRIAKACRVTHPFVGKIRASLVTITSENKQHTYTTKHGTTATMNTANIGASKPLVIPALPENTPEPIRERVDLGELPRVQAAALVETLTQVPDEVAEVCIEHKVSDPEAVLELADAYVNKLDTWNVFATTGALDGTIPGEQVTARDIEAHRERAAYEHRMAGREEANYKRDTKSSRAADEYVPQGHDLCQTPPYAIDPLLPYLDVYWTVWEPAAGEGLLVEALFDSGFTEVAATDIQTGKNFFEFEPPHFDAIITNPPFSLKYRWLERCYELGKPFALLLPVEVLGAKTAQQLMQKYGFEIMLLDQRVDFKMPNKGWEGAGSQFPVLWLCWDILPQQVMFGSIEAGKREFKGTSDVDSE